MHFLIQLRWRREVEFVLLRLCRNEREGIKCTVRIHTLWTRYTLYLQLGEQVARTHTTLLESSSTVSDRYNNFPFRVQQTSAKKRQSAKLTPYACKHW